MKINKGIRIVIMSGMTIFFLISSIFTIKTTYGMDTEPPQVVINFAGNLGDKGGPLWRPPDEGIPLKGVWENGYYTNDSRQSEEWIYINLTVTDNTGVDGVWLQWLNENKWTNWTYKFVHTTGDYYEINTSTLFETYPSFNYSFNIVANDTVSNSGTVCWNKIGVYENLTRRYVQLNCPQTDISYTPLYLYESERFGDGGVIQDDDDRLHHDQGPPCGDTGYLLPSIQGDKVEFRTCGAIIAYWFDMSVCIEPFVLDNIYFHVWWSTTDSTDMEAIGWDKSRTHFELDTIDSFTASSSDSRSHIHYDGPAGNDNYYLDTHLLDVSDTSFTDNDIYELSIKFRDVVDNPCAISNRSIMSFILLNVPDNNTLNNSFIDSDLDGLTDWQELYITYTSPFVTDTDNDGKSDLHEYLSGTDSNDFNDFTNDPPSRPYITGPTNGNIGEEYEYSFSLFDPCGDSMYLRIDWGNGTLGPWQGPFTSGKSVKVNHIWNQKGTFNIKAQAIDIYDAPSEIGTLKVTMPKNKPLLFNLNLLSWILERFLNTFPIVSRLLGFL